jgi:septal ring factor EnvC (AmiA/AmiB activator)
MQATDVDALVALARTLGTLGATVLLVTYLGRLAISYQRDFTLQYRELTKEQEQTIQRLRDRLDALEAETDSLHTDMAQAKRAVDDCRQREARLVRAIEALGGTIPP